MVEKLDLLQDLEALNVLRQAFAEHPMLPPDTPPVIREAMVELIVGTFSGTKKAWLHGIRAEDFLACVAFTTDGRFKPGMATMLSFVFRLFRLLGWRLTREFFRALSKRPVYSEPYLELMLLGTLPAYQGEGMGKVMLDFLYDFAGTKGYRGLILDVAKDTAAHRFYAKEGFVVDTEIKMHRMPICCMRRETVVPTQKDGLGNSKGTHRRRAAKP